MIGSLASGNFVSPLRLLRGGPRYCGAAAMAHKKGRRPKPTPVRLLYAHVDLWAVPDRTDTDTTTIVPIIVGSIGVAFPRLVAVVPPVVIERLAVTPIVSHSITVSVVFSNLYDVRARCEL
jgi:hypothetical protein